MAFQRYIELPNGAKMPIVGLGTWKSQPGQVTEAVKVALEVGYRHLDCAYVYANEAEVGAGLKAKIDDGTVKREDVFITSKLWNTRHHPDDVEEACQESLDSLGVAYLDLYLMHWPMAFKRGKENFPKDENGVTMIDDTEYTDTWVAMEQLVAKGKCKAIGVSNFNLQMIKDVQAIKKVPIANNQIELHPYLVQEELVRYCLDNNISVTAYSPLGSPDRPWVKETDPNLMADPEVVRIAEARGKTPAQVLIRFSLQRGIICIPKSVTPSRIKQNLETLDFELSPADMKDLMALNRNYRGCALEWIKHRYHPFPVAS
ncbi:alcohol dehydrogenase [NADP(+)] A-like isoform X3 [Acanthaster planci]|uniref:Alcohol dehydrogenase [NADP(+)] A-like isoform X2 n=1 Tax=Acanthaster planci TaxID=133434 RepID=A0A8B7Y0D1_ACAPL|nr:alcohol dehydrogenase [NADP(+)] A-like isoform X2 [Acanthaster planci]XP_022086619.1 alcohol dehydrogenase [NADP(+)] A-like isoform X3 [Acanthaster planci]